MISGDAVHRLERFAGVCSLRECAPGAARRRVTFLAGTRKVIKRSAFKCKRTFDRAGEPGPPTPPLEVRLEMRSVCAVPYVPPQLRGTGAPAVPPNSPTNASRPCRASAACLLIPGAVLQMGQRALCLAYHRGSEAGSGGGRGRYQKASSACSAPARSVYVGLLGGTAGAPVPRSFGGTERYSAHWPHLKPELQRC